MIPALGHRKHKMILKYLVVLEERKCSKNSGDLSKDTGLSLERLPLVKSWIIWDLKINSNAVMDYNPMNVIKTCESILIWKNGGKGKTFPSSKMPTNKYRRYYGVRKSSADAKSHE